MTGLAFCLAEEVVTSEAGAGAADERVCRAGGYRFAPPEVVAYLVAA